MKTDIRFVGCVLAGACVPASAAIEFIGEPFNLQHSVTGPVFWYVQDNGDAYGREYLDDFPTYQMVGLLAGEFTLFDTGVPGLHLYGPMARSPSGRWMIVDAGREIVGQHSITLESVEGVYDTQTGEYRLLDLPDGVLLPRAIDDSGRRVAGFIELEDGPGGAGFRCYAWVQDDDGYRLLDAPEPPPGRSEWTDLTVQGFSSDGSRILGGVWWDNTADSPSKEEVVLWADGVPAVLPHAIDAEHVSSFPLAISPDGLVVMGATSRLEFTPGDHGQGGSWRGVEAVTWRWENGAITHTAPNSLDHPVGYPDPIYILSESLELAEIEAWLDSLGVDLEGHPFVWLLDISPGHRQMVALLGIDNELEQQALIPLPCSVADVTADHAIGLDDAEAYAERFLAGNPLADLSGDGALDLSDIMRYVALYQDGCPEE